MSDTWGHVLAVAPAHGVRVLTDEELDEVVAQVVSRYVSDATSRWWWASLKMEPASHPYGGNGLQTLAQLLPPNEAVLLVTDEQPRPSGGIVGLPEQLLAVVSDSPGFEFVLTPRSATWVIFDTHQNRALTVGLPAA